MKTLEILAERRGKWAPFVTALRSFPGRVQLHDRIEGEADLLAVWGACGPRQWPALQRYHEIGRPVLCLDTGYFCRAPGYGDDQQVKIAINASHPEALPDAPPDRFDRLGIALRDDCSPQGPVVIAGLGVKTRRWLYGTPDLRWELSAAARVREALPGRRIAYRPKGKRIENLAGCLTLSRAQYTIEQVLSGASLVISRHSNVCAVDAVIAGVPAVVETGPGVNLWPRDLRITHPDHDRRLDYLRRLAWWSWSLAELRRGEHWDWVLSQCN